MATSLITECATAPADGGAYPAVVNYSMEFLARAADEIDGLRAGAAVEQLLADCQVMREQARVCQRK